MDLKQLYAAAAIRLGREVPLPRFLLAVDAAARSWLAKYPPALLLSGAYFTPQSLNDALPLAEGFYPALLDAVSAAETGDADAARSSEVRAENAYLALWRASARGKRIRGAVW